MPNLRPFARTARLPFAGTLIAVTLTLAGCGAAAAPSPSPLAPPGADGSPKPTPTAVPGQGGTGNTGGGTDPGSGAGSGSGGSTGGNVGGGITFPLPPDPNTNPLLGDAKVLTPTKDLVNQRNANVQMVRAAIGADGKALAELRWYSGVEPCNSLDSVQIVQDDAAKTIHLTVVEGSGQGDQMCIEIAELHATVVDLGTLAPGTWTISAEGDAPAIPLEVP